MQDLCFEKKKMIKEKGVKAPVILYQNRTVLYRKILLHHLHLGRNAVLVGTADDFSNLNFSQQNLDYW